MELIFELFFLGFVFLLAIVIPIWLKERKIKKENNSIESHDEVLTLEKLIFTLKNSKSAEEILQAKDDFLVYFTPFPNKENEDKISEKSKKHFEFLELLFTVSIIEEKERQKIMEEIRRAEKPHKVEIGFMWRRLNPS